MGLRERTTLRMQKKMSKQIARHLGPGEYVELRPLATVEFQGRQAQCSPHITDRAIYLVVEKNHVSARVPVENLVEIVTDLPSFVLKWIDPEDGTRDGMQFTIRPAATAGMFISYVLKAYENVTGHRFGEPPTTDV